MCSAKLERWAESGVGLEPILSDGGSGLRPSDAAELLRDCEGEVAVAMGTGTDLRAEPGSVMVVGGGGVVW